MTLTERIEELVALSFAAGYQTADQRLMESGTAVVRDETITRCRALLEAKEQEVAEKLKTLLEDLGQYS